MTWRIGSNPLGRLGLLSPFGRLNGPSGQSRQTGLTLVEILISVVVLASAVVLIMQALARSAYALSLAKNRLKAYTLASEQMANLEMGLRQGLLPKTRGQLRSERDLFQWQAEIAPTSEDPELGLVVLTVAWRQGRHDYEEKLSALCRLPKEEP